MNRTLVSVENHVAHVRLNRPDKRNGLDLAMFEAIVESAARVSADRSVRAVVLSGEGKGFCAGLDWASFMADASAASKLLERGSSVANLAQAVGWAWVECPVPVIAAVHGAAIGGGLQIALGADIRLVAPDAQLSVMEIRYGLVPDMGVSKTLLRLVRPDVAKELMFTGRVFSGEEAVRLGVCTRVEADPVAAALTLAQTIAAQSPHAIRAGKKLVDEASELDIAAALKLETELQLTLMGSANQMEAVQATMMKRAAEFVD
jgi:enoyl-CoA hydratase/carnithine racemase